MIGRRSNTYTAPGLGRAVVVDVVQNGQTFLQAKNEVARINKVLQVGKCPCAHTSSATMGWQYKAMNI